MKRFAFIALSLLISQSALAQLSPVLHDEDGLPIGNAVGFGTALNIEYVNIISLKGHRAKMTYGSHEPPPDGNDLPGYSAREFFGSTDCTGDPVLIPTPITETNVVLNEDFSNAPDFLSNSKLYSAGLDKLQSGDMFTFGGISYYVPLDAVPTTIETKSMRYSATGGCQLIERCSHGSWAEFGKLIVRDYNQDACPNVPTENLMDLQYAKFQATGFSLSIVKPNDPAVTGFQSTKYKGPLRIKYVDIGLILRNGFEAPTE